MEVGFSRRGVAMENDSTVLVGMAVDDRRRNNTTQITNQLEYSVRVVVKEWNIGV